MDAFSEDVGRILRKIRQGMRFTKLDEKEEEEEEDDDDEEGKEEKKPPPQRASEMHISHFPVRPPFERACDM